MIQDGRSRRGGWSERQFVLLGVPYPPQKGWRKTILGKEFKEEVIKEFLKLKDRHLPGIKTNFPELPFE